ncbi:MAG: O-antigen ligase family protein, partial [Patescibacteria group bacterium]
KELMWIICGKGKNAFSVSFSSFWCYISFNMPSLEKGLRYFLITAIFAAVLLTPFLVFDSMFFPYIIGKASFFRIVVTLMVGAWVALAFLDRRYIPPFNWITAIFGAFVLWMAIANSAGIAPLESFWSNFERMGGYLTLLCVFAFFFISTSVMESKRLWFWLFHLSILAALVMGMVALTEHAEGVSRAPALLGNPIYLAGYMLFHVFLSVYFLLHYVKNNIYISVFYGVLAIFFVTMVLITGTRGAMLGLVSGLFFSALVMAFRKGQKRWVKITAFASVAVIFLVGSLLTSVVFINNYEPAKEVEWAGSFYESAKDLPGVDRFAGISLTEGDALARFLLWDMALEAMKERPVLGWGQENYIHVFNSFYRPEMFDREEWFDRAHNIFLEWGVAGGFTGMLLYTAIFLSAVILLWRSREIDGNVRAVFIGLLVAHATQNFFVFENITSYVFFATFLGFAAAVTSQRQVGAVTDSPLIPYRQVKTVVLPAVVIFVLLVTYSVHIKTIQSNMMIIDGMRGFNCGVQVKKLDWEGLNANSLRQIEKSQCGKYLPDDLSLRSSSGQGYSQKDVLDHVLGGSLDLFREAREKSLVGRQESAEMLSVRAGDFLGQGQEGEIRKKVFEETEDIMSEAVEEASKKTRPLVFLGHFYLMAGANDKAAETLESALSTAPKRQYIMLLLADAYNRLGEHQKALEISKEAHELDPSFKEPVIKYAVSARYLGDEEKVSEILEPLPESEVIFEEALLEPFLRNEEYEKVLEKREERLDFLYSNLSAKRENLNENELKNVSREYERLIGTYLQLDRKTEAVETAEQAAERFPQLEQAAESVIKEMERQSSE